MILDIIDLDKLVTQFKTEQPKVVRGIDVQLFNPKTNKPKPDKEDPEFSEDVCIIDENGLIGVACFSFEDNTWVFPFDTLIDYNGKDAETKWKWYYPPVNSANIEW